MWRYATLLGIAGTAVPMTAIVSSLQYQSAGLTALLLTTGPAITVLLAHFFLADEPLYRRKISGIIFALGGAALLAVRRESGLLAITRANPLGYGLTLLAVLAVSGTTIYARKYMRHFDPFDVASIRMLVAAATVMPLSGLMVGVNLANVDGRASNSLKPPANFFIFSKMSCQQSRL